MQELFDADDHAEMVAEQIERAQLNLDLHPSYSAYWDSRAGQDDLEIIHALNLQPRTTEQERRDAHYAALRETEET